MTHNYDRRKKIVNFHESGTRAILKKSARNHGARVYTKLKIADVLDLGSSGLDNDHFSYGCKAHFDFVVADENETPLFAVEFDGPHHGRDSSTKKNDEKKNLICEKLDFPLARVRDEHIFRKARGINYLTWLTELYFSSKVLVQAQRDGIIPWDEPLNPMMFCTNPNIEGHFPLFISSEARDDIYTLHTEGVLNAPTPDHFYGYDDSNHGVALVMIGASSDMLLASSSSIYLIGFGITADEVAEEIATVNLAQMARDFRDTCECAVHKMLVREKLASLIESTGGHLSSGGTGSFGFPVCFQSIDGESKWLLGTVDDAPSIQFDVRAR